MQAPPSTLPNDASPIDALKNVVLQLQKSDCEGEQLKLILKNYHELLVQLSELDIYAKEATQSVDTEYGQAIGATPAARCIKDWKRTKIFIRGILKAIEAVQARKSGPVHIFYAGTGPFATLLLPIMAIFSPSELQCSLMEINPFSFEMLKRMIDQLGFGKFVKEYIPADATKYKFTDPDSIDILLSETMQNGLRNEPQVPILMNLMPQLPESCILIPQQIEVQVALMQFTPFIKRTKDTPFSDYCIPLESVLNISANSSRFYTSAPFPQTVLRLKKETMIEFHSLAALTDIQVYNEEWLRFDECELTKPVPLDELTEISTDRILKMQYQISGTPGFKVEWENC